MNVSLRAAVDADFEACRRTYFGEMDWVNERLGLKRDEQESMFRKLWDPTQVCVIQADGVDVGWLQTVVSKSEHMLGQIFVDAERARHGAGDLRHFEAMGEPSAVMIALVIDEDLRLVGQPAESGRMQDAVAVPGVKRARGAWRLGHEAAPALALIHGVRRQGLVGFAATVD